MLYDVVNYVISKLQELDQNIFLVIGMALLTILIPLAIAIFGKKWDYETLDKNVILDHIIEAKHILIYIGLIFLPLIFWNIFPAWFRIIELAFWCAGIVFMIKILMKSYQWLKVDKFSLRFEYLKQLTNIIDMEHSWRSVWESNKINPQNEIKFNKIFLATIDKLIKDEIGKS